MTVRRSRLPGWQWVQPGASALHETRLAADLQHHLDCGLRRGYFVLVYSGLKLLRHLDTPRSILADGLMNTTWPESRAH